MADSRCPKQPGGCRVDGYHGVLTPPFPQSPGEWGITKMMTILSTSGPSELGSAQQRTCDVCGLKVMRGA